MINNIRLILVNRIIYMKIKLSKNKNEIKFIFQILTSLFISLEKNKKKSNR